MKADIIWLSSVDSTNAEARRRISDIDNLSVLSAFEQTAGRGQRGNTWKSAPGENLTFSIVLKFATPDRNDDSTSILPSIKACDQFRLTEIASLSVLDFLSSYGIYANIKWPNDIYVGPRKICGMLMENSLRGDLLSSSIIGIGLNINQRNFDVTLKNPTSLAIEHRCGACGSSMENSDQRFDLKECMNELMYRFTAYLEEYLASPPEPSYKKIREAYISRLWLLDVPADFIDYTCLPGGHLEGPADPVFKTGQCAGRRFSGIIRGVSPSGLLEVEDTEKGGLREFAFKEIGFIIPEITH